MKKYTWAILPLLIAGFFIGKYLYKMPKYSNGNPAAPITGTLLGGNNFELQDLRGQYVLIDFWGSWCGPCRRANPFLRELYQKFNTAKFEDGQGFTIVSVGVEKNETRWQNAIVQDQLDWPYHILDKGDNLRFFNSPIAKAYGIKEVPTTYLVNPIGDIIGVNLPHDQIERLLKTRLSK